MQFSLFCADVTGSAQNKTYPHRHNVTDDVSLVAAVEHDYVCAEYYNNERSNQNFIKSDCLAFDVDNEDTDDAAAWVTPATIEDAFPDVSFAVHFSKSHNVAKGNKSARPRFHVFFPISEVDSAGDYKYLKDMVYSVFPHFDSNAMDVARFFFGTPTPQVEFHEGIFNVDDYLFADEFDKDMPQGVFGDQPISEGKRNSTMSHFAGRIIKRYGDTEEAYNAFMERSELCQPPLEQDELDAIWASAQRFYQNTILKSEGYIEPSAYNQDFKYMPSDYSDLGQAELIASALADKIAYTSATGWMYYNGIFWDESDKRAFKAYVELSGAQLKEADDAYLALFEKLLDMGIPAYVLKTCGKELDKFSTSENSYLISKFKEANQYLKFATKQRSGASVSNAFKHSRSLMLKEIKDFDTHQFLLNTPAGTYDLRYGLDGLSPHKKENFISKVCMVSPSSENEHLWLDAVNEFFCGDTELIEYVHRCVGLACIGKVHQEALVIAYGEGRNGKSTFWNSISRVLGNYSGSISSDALTVGCKRNVKPEMAELKGKRLVMAAELEEGVRLSTSMLKHLCSTDEVTAEKKYQSPFSFIPTHTLVLYTNHLPRVGANDEGTWRRLIVIPFNAKINPSQDVKNYTEYLLEKCAGAILKWVIEGAKKVIDADYKLTKPKAVEDAIGIYRQNNDWLSKFFDEMCVIGDAFDQKSSELYLEYRAWAQRTGEYARSTADFYSALTSAGFERKKTKACNLVLGLRLKGDFEE